ncbi:MAG: hypothetical protein JF609_05140 [Verrucomicrobia bacterium]|nr:hypothetical protein [Verrucomicrobiota bacterium]
MKTILISTRRLLVIPAIVSALSLMTQISARADYQSTVIGDSPLAYYPLNSTVDPTGTTATDLSGNNISGTYNGSDPEFNSVPGPTAYLTGALQFDGFTSFVDLSTSGNAGLLQFTGQTAIEAWVQPADSTTFGDIVGKGYLNASGYPEIALRVNGPYGGNYYGYFGGPAVSGGSQTTSWVHVVLSNDGTTTSLYINGQLIQSTSDSTGSISFPSTVPWAIGDGTADGGTRFFKGNICQVAIYNHGLTSSQILAHFYEGQLNSMPSNSVPIITSQPSPQASFVGGSASFNVNAVSALAATNLWFKGTTPLTGKTNLTLTLNSLQLGDAGNYHVVIGNANGTTTSVDASLTVTVPLHLEWSGSGNSGTWDTASSVNWINVSNSSTTVFNSGDQVLYDDTAGAPTSVTVSGTVLPSLITVNSSANNYSLSGGTISGPGSLLKLGSSNLSITSAGSFTGTATVGGGLFYAGNNCLHSVSAMVVSNGATIDFGGGTYNSGQPVTIAGTGSSGQGALYNSYNDYPLQVLSLNLADDATVGGVNRWDLGNGTTISGPHTLTLDWNADGDNPYSEMTSVTVNANVAGITMANNSKLGSKNMDNAFQNPATMFTLNPNAQLIFWNGGWNGSLHVYGGAQVYLWTAPAAINGSTLILEDNAQWMSWSGSSDEPINSAMTLNGTPHVVIGDHNMIYTNVISGPGGFVEDYWNHAMILSASNTYTGPTVINNGPQVTLTGNGSISHSALIFFGGNSPNSTHLDVTGRSDQTLTLAGGQTLGGIGAINGSLTVTANATLAPAGTNTTISITTGANPVGAIAVSGNIALQGATVLKLNGSGTNDQVQAGGTIAYGGTLSLANISGNALMAGDTFQVFSGAGYSGAFSSVTPAPGAGLAWDLSQLNAGKVSVIATGNPLIAAPHIVGNQFIFDVSGGSTGANYVVLTTTNLLSPWSPLATNQFGNGSVTNPLKPWGSAFYMIKQ